MNTYQTTFHGLPVTVYYTTEFSEIEIMSVEWRGVEIQDVMTGDELSGIEVEMQFNLQADLFDAADFARQSAIEERMERKAA